MSIRDSALGRLGMAVTWALAAVVFAATVQADPIEVEVMRSDPGAIVLEYRVNDFFLEPVMIDGEEMSRVVSGDEAPLMTEGAPELPSVTRSVVIPDGARMRLEVVSVEYEDLGGVDIAPSRGILYRDQDPSAVPYVEGREYHEDAFFPAEVAELGDPYIMRDVRGAVLDVYPFRHNPVAGTLRVYRRIVIALIPDGPGDVNVRDSASRHPSAAFDQIYRHHFVNYDQPPLPDVYPAVTEAGEMLIICHDAWLTQIAPLVAHKNGVGIPTTAVGVSTIGNNATSIAAHIQSIYDTSDRAFVLLVGDSAQVATPTSSGGSSDPSYAKVAGSDDYPDVLIGRFSAETSAQVDTQVQRTIQYETTPATTQPRFKKGVGIGAAEGPGDDGELD